MSTTFVTFEWLRHVDLNVGGSTLFARTSLQVDALYASPVQRHACFFCFLIVFYSFRSNVRHSRFPVDSQCFSSSRCYIKIRPLRRTLTPTTDHVRMGFCLFGWMSERRVYTLGSSPRMCCTAVHWEHQWQVFLQSLE
ncbi:unnamed protein product [Ixodes pacificus]